MKTAIAALRGWAAERLWAIRPGSLDILLASFDHRVLVQSDGMGGNASEDDGPTLEVLDGVAIVPVVGPLVEASNECEEMMAELFGSTTYNSIRARLDAALASPAVNAIMLDIDSPGGTVAGVDATASAVKAAAQSRPLVAHVRGMGASGAYWLATSAPRIEAEEIAWVGSIGVVGIYEDDRRAAEAAGYDRHVIVSSNAPYKVPDLSTEAGRQIIRSHFDEVETIFIDRVASGRGVPTTTVLDDFGRGDVLISAEAQGVGMIDAISSRAATLGRLAERGRADRMVRPLGTTRQPYRPAARAAVPRPSRPAAAARGG